MDFDAAPKQKPTKKSWKGLSRSSTLNILLAPPAAMAQDVDARSQKNLVKLKSAFSKNMSSKGRNRQPSILPQIEVEEEDDDDDDPAAGPASPSRTAAHPGRRSRWSGRRGKFRRTSTMSVLKGTTNAAGIWNAVFHTFNFIGLLVSVSMILYGLTDLQTMYTTSQGTIDFQACVLVIFGVGIALVCAATTMLKLVQMSFPARWWVWLSSEWVYPQDSLSIWHAILDAPFVDLINGASKHRYFNSLVFLSIVGWCLWFVFVGLSPWLELPVQVNRSSLENDFIADVNCTGNALDDSAGAYACVNLTDPATKLPIAVEITCRVRVMVNRTAGPAPAFKGKVLSASVRQFDNTNEHAANATLDMLDALAETDENGVAIFKRLRLLGASNDAQYVFGFRSVSSQEVFSPPVRVKNDVESVTFSVADGADRTVIANTSQYLPDITVSVRTRFNTNMGRFDCRPWTDQAQCFSACQRCRTRTAACDNTIFSCTSFGNVGNAKCSDVTSATSNVTSATSNVTNASASDTPSSPRCFSNACMQQNGGTSDRTVTLRAWKKVPVNSSGAVLNYKWEVVPDTFTSAVKGDVTRYKNGTAVQTQGGSFPCNASSGKVSLILFFDALVVSDGVYKLQAISQGVVSDLSDSPDYNISRGDRKCVQVDGLSAFFDTSGMKFLKNAAWALLFLSIPFVYLNREDVSARAILLTPLCDLLRCKRCNILFPISLVVGVVTTSLLIGLTVDYIIKRWSNANECRGYTLYQQWYAIIMLSPFALGSTLIVAMQLGFVKHTSTLRLERAVDLSKLVLYNLKVVNRGSLPQKRGGAAETISNAVDSFIAFTFGELGVISLIFRPVATIHRIWAKVVNPSDDSAFFYDNPRETQKLKLRRFFSHTSEHFMFSQRFALGMSLSLLMLTFWFIFHLFLMDKYAFGVDHLYYTTHRVVSQLQDNITTFLDVSASMDVIQRAQQKANGGTEQFGPRRPPFEELEALRSFQERMQAQLNFIMNDENRDVFKAELMFFGRISCFFALWFLLKQAYEMFLLYKARMEQLRRGFYWDNTLDKCDYAAASNFVGVQAAHFILGYTILAGFLWIVLWLLFSSFTREVVWTFFWNTALLFLSFHFAAKLVVQVAAHVFLLGRTERKKKPFIKMRAIFEKVDILLVTFAIVASPISTLTRLAIYMHASFCAFLRLDTCLLSEKDKTQDMGYAAYCSTLLIDHVHSHPMKVAFLEELNKHWHGARVFREAMEELLSADNMNLIHPPTELLTYRSAASLFQMRNTSMSIRRRKVELRNAIIKGIRARRLTWALTWAVYEEKLEECADSTSDANARTGGHNNRGQAAKTLSHSTTFTDDGGVSELSVDIASLLHECSCGCPQYKGVVPHNCSDCHCGYEKHDPEGGGFVNRCKAQKAFLPLCLFQHSFKWWLFVFLHKIPALREWRQHQDRVSDVLIDGECHAPVLNTSWQPHVAFIQGYTLYYLETAVRRQKSTAAAKSWCFLNCGATQPCVIDRVDHGEQCLVVPAYHPDVMDTVWGRKHRYPSIEWREQKYQVKWCRFPDMKNEKVSLAISSLATDPWEKALPHGIVRLEDGSEFFNPVNYLSPFQPHIFELPELQARAALTNSLAYSIPQSNGSTCSVLMCIDKQGQKRFMAFDKQEDRSKWKMQFERAWRRAQASVKGATFQESDVNKPATFIGGQQSTIFRTNGWLQMQGVLKGKTPVHVSVAYTVTKIDANRRLTYLMNTEDADEVVVYGDEEIETILETADQNADPVKDVRLSPVVVAQEKPPDMQNIKNILKTMDYTDEDISVVVNAMSEVVSSKQRREVLNTGRSSSMITGAHDLKVLMDGLVEDLAGGTGRSRKNMGGEAIVAICIVALICSLPFKAEHGGELWFLVFQSLLFLTQCFGYCLLLWSNVDWICLRTLMKQSLFWKCSVTGITYSVIRCSFDQTRGEYANFIIIFYANLFLLQLCCLLIDSMSKLSRWFRVILTSSFILGLGLGVIAVLFNPDPNIIYHSPTGIAVSVVSVSATLLITMIALAMPSLVCILRDPNQHVCSFCIGVVAKKDVDRARKTNADELQMVNKATITAFDSWRAMPTWREGPLVMSMFVYAATLNLMPWANALRLTTDGLNETETPLLICLRAIGLNVAMIGSVLTFDHNISSARVLFILKSFEFYTVIICLIMTTCVEFMFPSPISPFASQISVIHVVVIAVAMLLSDSLKNTSRYSAVFFHALIFIMSWVQLYLSVFEWTGVEDRAILTTCGSTQYNCFTKFDVVRCGFFVCAIKFGDAAYNLVAWDWQHGKSMLFAHGFVLRSDLHKKERERQEEAAGVDQRQAGVDQRQRALSSAVTFTSGR